MNQSKKAPEVCADGPFKGYARLRWIHTAAQKRPTERMRNLMHHFNRTNLRRAFRTLDGSKASGIDHVTKYGYQQNLEPNLQALEQSLRGGGWRPKPAREVLIPKPQGGMRPLAVGCLEDKIVQTLAARILEAIYEPSFHRHSYGFRRGKSAHQALARAYEVIAKRKNRCVAVEMDIEKFFDSVDHAWLVQTIEERIADEHFLRLVRRMLRNSVLHEDGTMAEKLSGTPQGSPVSPVLANICLHVLLDGWFQQNWARKGEFVRYADDAVFVFSDEEDARAFQQELVARMAEAGLKLNLDKTRIVPFSAHAPKGTITLLGFELFWGVKRGIGKLLKVKTIPKRLARAMQSFTDWVKRIRNRKTTATIWKEAATKLVGHYNYYGVTSNERKLSHFYWFCVGALYRWLNRRSQRHSYSWESFKRRLRFSPLPRPPRGEELLDITSSEHGAARKHNTKSRMREMRTSGSVRSAGHKPVFT